MQPRAGKGQPSTASQGAKTGYSDAPARPEKWREGWREECRDEWQEEWNGEQSPVAQSTEAWPEPAWSSTVDYLPPSTVKARGRKMSDPHRKSRDESASSALAVEAFTSTTPVSSNRLGLERIKSDTAASAPNTTFHRAAEALMGPRKSKSLRRPASKAVEVESAELEKATAAAMKKQYSVYDYYKDEGLMQRLARHPFFHNLTILVVIANSVWLGVDADLNTETILFNAHPAIIVGENFFCIYFTLEIIVRFLAFQRKLNAFKDFWFSFDLFLALLIIVETWVTPVLLLLTGDLSGLPEGTVLLRLIRLVRLVRLTRLTRLLRSFPELMIIVKGLAFATRSVCVFSLLWAIITYAFAIIMRSLTEGSTIGTTFFKTVPESINTLLLPAVFGANADVINAIAKDNPGLWPIMVFFMALAGTQAKTFTFSELVNMVLGMRGSNPATVKDCKEQIRVTNSLIKRCFGELYEELEDKFYQVRQEIQSMDQDFSIEDLDNVGGWPQGEDPEGDAGDVEEAESPVSGAFGEGFYDAACPGSDLPDGLFEAPGPAQLPAPRANMAGAARRPGKQWVVAEERLPNESSTGDDFMPSESLLGKWVDSQGHSIHVLSTDAYSVRLLATMSKAMLPDKHLALKPVRLGAGWQCGHSILDPSWTACQSSFLLEVLH
eukprot:g1062.t1